MPFDLNLTDLDRQILASLDLFLPQKIYDFHAHLFHEDHHEGIRLVPELPAKQEIQDWREDMNRLGLYKTRTLSTLFFGTPGRKGDHRRINAFIRKQTSLMGDPWSRCLFLVSPKDNREETAKALRSGDYAGIKVYHLYANRQDTFNARIEEYAPEWMWELLNEVGGILTLHMVLHNAIADEQNQRDIIRLCRAWPHVQLVMAHAGRCFSHRHSLAGLAAVAHLPNVWIDTSAVCEAESFANALRLLGPQRILYGSDYPVSEFRGRCVTLGDGFLWLHPQKIQQQEVGSMTLVGLESLLALKESLEYFGATERDIEDIFWNNALRCLNISNSDIPATTGEVAWLSARKVISCGTGLLSKRAESFLTPRWPTYFSKASGCHVWDSDGRQFTDFVGGVGAVFLGYADSDVNRAVHRRLHMGSYCSFLPREEIDLAHLLLELHPGMGKVRYARGGGEAMLLAVRIARAATNRSGIAFCGYHGWHDWYLAANLGCEESNRPIPGLSPLGVPAELTGTSFAFHYNDIESLRNACNSLKGNLAAIVMEPLRLHNPTPEFLEAIQQITRETGALLVVDEVTSGMRYGFPGISTNIGLKPDLVVYAKAISNGIPFGVVVGEKGVMEQSESSFISSSYWTDGLGPAAALAVLRKMQREKTQQSVWRKGVDFYSALTSLATRYPQIGLQPSGQPVSAMLLVEPGPLSSAIKMRLIEAMLDRGFLLGSVTYLMAAHRDEDLAGFLTALEESMELVSNERERGLLDHLQYAQSTTIGRLA